MIKASAIILHLKSYTQILPFYAHRDPARLGILGNIAERFLENPVNIELDFLGKQPLGVIHVHGDLDILTGEFFKEVLQGRRQAAMTPQQAMQPDANEIADALFKRLRESGVDMRAKMKNL